MKAFVFSLLVFCLLQHAAAQVSGRLAATGGRPIAFANVLLLRSADSVLVKAGLTNESGFYQINHIAPGRYRLQCSSIGYESWYSPVFELTATLQQKDFGTLVLTENNKQLNQVVVRAQRPLYQQRPEGTVINVENNVLTKGSSVLEVLERSPGVLIDRRNSNILLNGKEGVMVMLNGKLLRMSVDQVLSLLGSLSANEVEKIELLTTPPAGYDADGNAGIINIVLKKNKQEGTNGSLSLTGGYGWREKGTAGASFSHNKGKLDWYGSYTFSHDRSHGDFFGKGSEIMPVLGGPGSFLFWHVDKPVRDNHNAMAGLDVQLNTSTTMGASVNYNYSTMASIVENYAVYTIYTDSLLLFNSRINGKSRGNNVVSSVYAEKKISNDEELNLAFDYLYYDNNNPTTVQSSFRDTSGQATFTDNGAQFAPVQKGFSNTVIRVGVIKLDYTKQWNKNLKLETGIKGTYTKSTSLSGIEVLENNQWKIRTETLNNIVVKESIGAAYASVTAQINASSSLVVGARYEYAHTPMNDGKTGESIVNRKLGVLFPSLFYAKKLHENAALQFSYSKRISRPSYNDLSSFIAYNDPVSVFTGNPLLKPTITHNVKLGYHYRGYAFSLLFSRDNHPIVRYQLASGPGGNLVYISPQNLAWQNNLTLEALLPFKLNNWWSMHYGLVGGWRQYRVEYTPQPAEKSYFGYSVNFSQSFQLPAQFSAELSGWYNGISYNGTVKGGAVGALNAGIKKELKNNKGIIQLAVTDLLRTIHYNSDIGSVGKDAFSTKAHVKYNPESAKFPIIKLSYTRSFGSTTNSRRRQENNSADERERIRKD